MTSDNILTTNTEENGIIPIDSDKIFASLSISLNRLSFDYSNPNNRQQLDLALKPSMLSYTYSLQLKVEEVKNYTEHIVENPCIDDMSGFRRSHTMISNIEQTLLNFHEQLINEEQFPNQHSSKLLFDNKAPEQNSCNVGWALDVLEEEITTIDTSISNDVMDLHRAGMALNSKLMHHYIAFILIPIKTINYILQQAEENIQEIKSKTDKALKHMKHKYSLFKQNISEDGAYKLIKGYENKNFTSLMGEQDKLKEQLTTNAICSQCYDPSRLDFTEAGACAIYKAENTTEANLQESFDLVYQYEYVSEKLKSGFAISLNIDLTKDLTFLPEPEHTDSGCMRFAKYISNAYKNNKELPLPANDAAYILVLYYIDKLNKETFDKLVQGALQKYIDFLKKMTISLSFNDTSHVGQTLKKLNNKTKEQILQLIPESVKANCK